MKTLFDNYIVNRDDDSTIKVTILFQDKEFVGRSKLHPKDKEFNSEKVGTNIAFLRAELELYKYLREQAKKDFNIIHNFCFSSCSDKNIIYNLKQYKKIKNNYKYWQKKVRIQYQIIHNYIADINKVFLMFETHRVFNER